MLLKNISNFQLRHSEARKKKKETEAGCLNTNLLIYRGCKAFSSLNTRELKHTQKNRQLLCSWFQFSFRQCSSQKHTLNLKETSLEHPWCLFQLFFPCFCTYSSWQSLSLHSHNFWVDSHVPLPYASGVACSQLEGKMAVIVTSLLAPPSVSCNTAMIPHSHFLHSGQS